ncbi:MAG: autotransporter outer membrane beta-barrel domain-containing protein [Bacteroidales bacterium]|nr:autotransporter outer membrane beta-barrel domain-containing protein [Bacteroidales bacterium]
MKKSFILAALLLAAMTMSFAQESSSQDEKEKFRKEKWHGTVIGKAYLTDYGLTAGYGLPSICLWGDLVMDINCKNNNYRTRIMAGCLERWYWPELSVNAQYLLPICRGFYFFPSVGLHGELHNTMRWKEAYQGKHPEAQIKENPKWGPGSWGMGVQLGGGLEYQINQHIAIFAEARYSFMYNTVSHWTANLGVVMNFSKGRPTIDNFEN